VITDFIVDLDEADIDLDAAEAASCGGYSFPVSWSSNF
jgi:hypothetical protein